MKWLEALLAFALTMIVLSTMTAIAALPTTEVGRHKIG